MVPRFLVSGLAVVTLFGGGVAGCHRQPRSTATTANSTANSSRPAVSPLTVHALRQQPKLLYSSVIYYAVKHTGVQRWQEVSDFKLGWQVETEQVHGTKRYSVWPDAHIQEAQKKLEPNWFTLKGQRVTYESFVVHSDGDTRWLIPRCLRWFSRLTGITPPSACDT
ncbi:hypothetical protein [Levilactobacillus acidifarinae]|uniref:hypothetical protein n=1 Tax=Levilactobacillus acidifarinae TaxID=267364 RepID=UPI0009F9B40F|nr:hypothetical protein [Levilactobacillus acidifarinae]